MFPSRRCFGLVLALVAVVALVRTPVAAAAPPAPVAAVFLIDGSWPFMGNDGYTRAESCRNPPPGTPCRIVKVTPGAHRELVAALGAGKRGVGALLGRGAQAALVTYGRTAEVRVPMGPARRVTGKRLGAQRAFAGVVSHDLAAGLDAALTLAREADAVRRVVIVIGSDARPSPRLEELKVAAVADGVAVIYLELRTDDGLTAGDLAAATQLAAMLGAGGDGSHAAALSDPAALPAALRDAIARVVAP